MGQVQFEVGSEAEWVRLVDRMHDFHDGIVCDVSIKVGSHVLAGSYEAVLRPLGTVLALMQFQRPDHPACLARFEDVEEVTFRQHGDVDPARATFSGHHTVFEILTLRVVAQRLRVDLLGEEYLGPPADGLLGRFAN